MRQAVIYFGFRNPRGHKRGVENVIAVQAHALHGCCKYYIFFDDHSSVARWGNIVAIGIKITPARFIALNLIVAQLKSRLIRRGYEVILHSHHYLMSLFLWSRTNVFTVHDGLWYQKKTTGSKIPWFFYLIERIVYGRVDHVHCNSRFTYRNSLLKVSGKAASIIYCSTPLERIRKLCIQESNQIAPLHKLIILSVRSMEQRARIDLLIEVAELSQIENRPFVFRIAGTGPLLEFYRKEIRSRGLANIDLLGYVSDSELVRLYAGCDAVLMTCEDGEGFGLPVIEGYLFGKPVIASNRCAVPEVLISPEYLIENSSDEIVNQLILRICAEAPAKLFQEYYRKRFSNFVIEAQYAEFYETVFSEMPSVKLS
jgi:glycosyltransferase involved in cell wall biosynthesis